MGLKTNHAYKGHLLHVQRYGSHGAYACFAMRLSAPGNLTPPFVGRISVNEEFTGVGAKQRAYDVVKSRVDEWVVKCGQHTTAQRVLCPCCGEIQGVHDFDHDHGFVYFCAACCQRWPYQACPCGAELTNKDEARNGRNSQSQLVCGNCHVLACTSAPPDQATLC